MEKYEMEKDTYIPIPDKISNVLEWKSSNSRIINLTQHAASEEQKASGVEDLTSSSKESLIKFLTFDEIPSPEEMTLRARNLAALASGLGRYAMIGGAPFFMATLERTLINWGITPVYAFSRRNAVEEDGVKKSIFKHIGFVGYEPDETPVYKGKNYMEYCPKCGHCAPYKTHVFDPEDRNSPSVTYCGHCHIKGSHAEQYYCMFSGEKASQVENTSLLCQRMTGIVSDVSLPTNFSWLGEKEEAIKKIFNKLLKHVE